LSILQDFEKKREHNEKDNRDETFNKEEENMMGNREEENMDIVVHEEKGTYPSNKKIKANNYVFD
jgi:hypothetical protein